VELLVVIALIAVIIGIGSTSFGGHSGATRLTGAAVQCANLLESARDAAILRKNPVAVAIFPPASGERAALTVFEYQPLTQAWARVWQWERLPAGVVMDTHYNPAANSAVAGNAPELSPALPVTDRDGQSYAPGQAGGYAYLVFLPTGALLQPHSRPGRLRLVEGVAEAGQVRRTGPSEQFVDLVVNASTGRLKLVKPGESFR